LDIGPSDEAARIFRDDRANIVGEGKFLEGGTQGLILRYLFAVEWTIFQHTFGAPSHPFGLRFERLIMSIGTILIIILILILLGALPTWPYSSGWGYYPSSGLGFVVVILLILVLLGRI
jgi:hypothetical protein